MKIQKHLCVIFAMTFAIFFFSSCGADRIDYPAKYTYYEVGNYHDERAYVFSNGIFEPVVGSEMIDDAFSDVDGPTGFPFLELTLINETDFSLKLEDGQTGNNVGTYTTDGDDYTFRIMDDLDLIEFRATRDGDQFRLPASQHIASDWGTDTSPIFLCVTVAFTDNEGEEPDEIINPCDRDLTNFYDNPQEQELYFVRYFDLFFQSNN